MSSEIHGTVGILGYGVDGQGVAAWLRRQSGVSKVIVFDDNGTMKQLNNVKIERGKSLNNIDVLFRSPGFPLTHPLIKEAKERGIPITSSTVEVLKGFPGITVGITGSNGKTTCTRLIELMLKAEYGEERVERGGNDGVPRLDLLHHDNAPRPTPHALVLELSSFQLIDCPASPNVAVVLNITPNHLNWHKDMREYAEAKRRAVSGERRAVSGHPSIAVLNQNDPIVKTFAEGTESEVRWFEDPPKCAIRCVTHPDTVRAAVTAARALKVSEENIVNVLESFPGVSHRLEFIRELDGVRYYNDSSCTTPESAIVACNAFPVGKLILLLGGRDKGMDFMKLYEAIKQRNVRVVPYGEMAPTFQKNIPVTNNYQLITNNSFKGAIVLARFHASHGDSVVLSPACASFDMFKDAKERGREFTRIVEGLR